MSAVAWSTRERRKGHPCYRHAVEWLALNDDAANDNPEDIARYTTTCLVADLWGKDQAVVGQDVANFRKKVKGRK